MCSPRLGFVLSGSRDANFPRATSFDPGSTMSRDFFRSSIKNVMSHIRVRSFVLSSLLHHSACSDVKNRRTRSSSCVERGWVLCLFSYSRFLNRYCSIDSAVTAVAAVSLVAVDVTFIGVALAAEAFDDDVFFTSDSIDCLAYSVMADALL